MKIYISSTQKDLSDHRAAVAAALRKVDYTVLQMEDYTAQDDRPLDRCVAHVQTADVYVGIFAWRYGYVPDALTPIDPTAPPLPVEIIPGDTSITEAEYIAAGSRVVDGELRPLPRLIFLVSDDHPWPPCDMDAHNGKPDDGRKIAEFRSKLSRNHIVSFFTTPDNLAGLVLAAVQRQDLSRKLDLRMLQQVDASEWMMNAGAGGANASEPAPNPLQDTHIMTITEHIQGLDDEAYMIVDIGTGRRWWSTRLYFLASLLVDLTDVRLMVFVDDKGCLFGTSNAVSVRDALARRFSAIRAYESNLAFDPPHHDIEQELFRRSAAWDGAMIVEGGEHAVKTWVRKQELRRYLGDALVQGWVEWPGDDDGRATVMTVLSDIIKWPQDLVPVVRDGKFYKVVERAALCHEIASIFIEENNRPV